ncbi:hypothetical protein BMY_0227 [Wohlfahrtiimonas chitiniclastica]|nr:CrcB family protein [Wohlfahrtiimonas chitiniclastica]KZS22407.1 hypothetical protein BMY_0227 [Wohlfahrtiimonas chitiniclastica]
MNQLIIITLIGIGGGLGAILRHLSGVAIVRIWPHAFPMATFCINLLGALLIGVLMAILTAKEAQSSLLKYFFITGLCGGYTTFPHSPSKIGSSLKPVNLALPSFTA